MKTRRKIILDTVEDLVGSLLWYDRKEDEDLPRGAIEEALEASELTIDDMIEVFANKLRHDLETGRS